MLSVYRVLDLTDTRGEIAGMLLGDLGADVIRVEPPEGSAARRAGPWLAQGPEDLRSLQFLAYNRNKRSIAIDLSQPGGRDELLALVASADFVLESAPEGELARHGIAFDALRAAQPRIVHVQISPFGTSGPYAEFAASDLTIAAMGGPVSLQGVPERAPIRVSLPQVWRHAGSEAAVAALVAHARMLKTGQAQHVDVSAQSAMTWTMLNATGAIAIQGRDFERNGSWLQLGTLSFPLVFDCADGHVVVIPNGDFVASLLDWMIEDGIVGEEWRTEPWAAYEARLLAGEELRYPQDVIFDAVARFLAPYRKRDLLEGALARNATIAPVNTIEDLLSFPHLSEREFWDERTLPDGSRARFAGPSVRLADGAWREPRPAPRIDAHGPEIRRQQSTRPRKITSPAPTGDASSLPFAGLKVADFSWIGVGPITAKYFADHGATVVRVESAARPDKLRIAGPFKDEKNGIDRSQFYAEMNASKLGLALDLRKPAAIDVAKKLIGWADVYLESFRPGTVDKLGIGYETARALNPGIVMLSTCLMGQTGPTRNLAGYGYHAGAVAGFYEVTGWPDLPPSGPWMAYTDTIAPRFTAAALMAAVDRQRRTGEGQYIDGAQLESGLQFLAPELLDHQTSGAPVTRAGNHARDAAPHGVYPCAGEDQWCAIAIDTDEQWRALREALGKPAWMDDPTLGSAQGRIAKHDEIDLALATWTRDQDPREAMRRLLAHSVPAGVVQRSSDLLRDPQYLHRGFYRHLEHPAMGTCPYAGHQFRIAGYDSGPRHAAPMLGQHSFEILENTLGIDAEEIASLMAAGVIE